MARKRIRSLEDVWFRDGLWPAGGLGYPNPNESFRHQAIAEVLCSIPEDGYRKLKKSQFQWFIPHPESQGGVYPFPADVEEKGLTPYAKVLYLDPV